MRADAVGERHDGLDPSNPSEIVRRGREALDRHRRVFEDWLDIAEALQVGRLEVIQAVHTNQPSGRRYEKAMADWLLAHSFHVIDKCTRNHLSECLKHRREIDSWRATLTEGERFRFNHPSTVLRRWKAATVVPDPNAPHRPSAIENLKTSIAQLEEENHKMKREIAAGGGDLWSPQDRPEAIATVMLQKLSPTKAERVARDMLRRLRQQTSTASTALEQ